MRKRAGDAVRHGAQDTRGREARDRGRLLEEFSTTSSRHSETTRGRPRSSRHRPSVWSTLDSVDSQCQPQLACLSGSGWHGRFCDDERVGTLLTACGGVAQTAPNEAPFASVPSPIDRLSVLERYTMMRELIFPRSPPPCSSTTRLRCVDIGHGLRRGCGRHHRNWGVLRLTERVPVSSQQVEWLSSNDPEVWVTSIWAKFGEVCGDAFSSSPGLARAVLDGRSSSGVASA